MSSEPRIMFGDRVVTPETVIDTAVDLADMFDVSRQTIFDWKRKGLPVREDGRYQFIDVFQWWTLYIGAVTVEERLAGTEEELQRQIAENNRLKQQLKPAVRRKR